VDNRFPFTGAKLATEVYLTLRIRII